MLVAACLAGLFSCGLTFQQADLESFIETGLTVVSLRSVSFDAGSGSLGRIPSNQNVTASLAIINPKAFDAAYSLGWDVDGTLFTTQPPTSPKPDDATHLSFSFVLLPEEAEHRTITFTLGKYVASINRTYDAESFSILCDSPPNPPSRIATIVDGSQMYPLAVLLPSEISDDDLDKLRIAWRREDSSSSSEAVYDIAALAAFPDSSPFESAYDCYFQPPDAVAGYGYEYSVAIIDAGGQESSELSTSSAANVFYLNYDGNGNTSGTAPASVPYHYGTSATVASAGDLLRTDFAFYAWNTAADGSGASYSPGDSFTIPAGEVTLFARWVTNCTVIAFDLGTQALSFSSDSFSLKRGETLAVSCGNATLAAGGSDWKWYVDGSLASEGGSSFSWDTTGKEVGQYILSCSVAYGGSGYSGSFRVTVTQ